MRIAILSAGPSLRQTFDPDARTDLRIGVNAAAAHYCCDWWACGDAQTFERVVPVGLPVLWTLTESDSRYRQRREVAERFAKHRVERWSGVGQRVGAPACWSNWSITAALTLAVDLGATVVDVYGHDCNGTIDTAGFDLLKRAENWRRVKSDWETIKAWAINRGVRVHEHHMAEVLT